MVKRLSRFLLLFCSISLVAGCGSARFSSTLKPSGNPDLTLSDQRFRLADFQLAYAKGKVGMYPIEPKRVISRAGELYPRIFVNDWGAVGVTASATAEGSGMTPLGPMLTGFTLGLIPFPSYDTTNFQVAVSVVDERGDKVPVPPVKFTREDAMWMSLVGPLGCLPVPGESLLPRETVFFDLSDDGFRNKSTSLTTDTLVEAVVSALREAPPERMAAIAKARQARMKEVNIEGASYWSFLAPQFTKGVANQERADQFAVLLYQERPRPDINPVDEAVVARRDADGRWQPVRSYLRRVPKGLVSVSALLENGAPGRVVVSEVSEPPLEDFIPLPAGTSGDKETAEVMGWSNRVLIQAKNRTLPTLLKTKSSGELLDLVGQVENAYLDLNRMAELAKDRAQKAIADGGDGGVARDLSLTCRERSDILKPILVALKQEIAARGGK